MTNIHARHNLTLDPYQQTFDQLTGAGILLARVNAYEVGGQPLVAAILEQ
jgi:hypothetical protein